MNVPLTIRLFFVALSALCLLPGCVEFQGPTWSPDAKLIAYTLYARTPEPAAPNAKVKDAPAFATSVYLYEPDIEQPATPRLLAENAAFPNWSPDGELFFLGERNEQGHYTKLFKLPPGGAQPEVVLPGLRASAMQLAYDRSPIVLLMSGQSAQTNSALRVELWNAENGKRTDLGQLGAIYGPALSFNGKLLAYSTRPAQGHAVLMLSELNGKESIPVFPTTEFPEPGASSFIARPFPDTERFLIYGSGAAALYTTQGRPGAWKFSKIAPPPGLASPVMARVAADSKTAAITFARIATGRVTYESYDYDFARGVWTKLEVDSPTLIGGQMLVPTAKKTGDTRRAWMSQAGLAIGDAKSPVIVPISAAQLLGASAMSLKLDAPKALEYALKAQDAKPPHDDPEAVTMALYRAYVASKNFDRACDVYEQSVLLSPINSGGLRLIFPPQSGLPPPAADWVAAELRKMDELIAGAPANRMIPVLKEAFKARQAGEQRKAIEFYQKAFDLCADKARTGGVKFLQALCELEQGSIYQAGEYFDSAARNDDFPQADYAAGLGALSYLLHGKPETALKANAILATPAARKSRFANDFSQFNVLIKNKPQHQHGSTKESISADGSAHAWAEFDVYQLPFASLKPAAFETKDGKLIQLHVGVRTLTASSIWTNKSNMPVLRVAQAVTPPLLSPNGNLMAFTVSGDVFPLNDNFCELFVTDLKGTVHVGNAAAAAAGRTRGRKIISKFSWPDLSSVKIEGVDVDVFGGQKPLETVVPITPGAGAIQ